MVSSIGSMWQQASNIVSTGVKKYGKTALEIGAVAAAGAAGFAVAGPVGAAVAGGLANGAISAADQYQSKGKVDIAKVGIDTAIGALPTGVGGAAAKAVEGAAGKATEQLASSAGKDLVHDPIKTTASAMAAQATHIASKAPQHMAFKVADNSVTSGLISATKQSAETGKVRPDQVGAVALTALLTGGFSSKVSKGVSEGSGPIVQQAPKLPNPFAKANPTK